MKRREFFTTAATSVAGLMALTTFSFANTNGNTITIPELKNQRRRFTITQKHTPIAPLVLRRYNKIVDSITRRYCIPTINQLKH